MRKRNRITRTYRYVLRALLALIVLGGVVSHAAAEESIDWDFEFTPYVFFAALEGTAGARGIETEIDESFSDIWNNLDIGAMGIFLAEKGPLTLMFDAVYMKLDDQAAKSVTGPGGQVTVDGALDVTTSLTVLQPSVLYRVIDSDARVDLGVGVRYTRTSLDLDLQISPNPGIIFPGGGASLSGSDSWIDVVAVARVTRPVSDRWSLMAYGDVGGGGSSLTYQLVAGANWAMRDRLTVKAGFRYAKWDYEDEGAVWDMSASGPFLGLGFTF